MNEIKNHPNSLKYFIVVSPSPAITKRANELITGKWAKIQENGTVICHNNFRNDFETIINREAQNSTIAPEFESWQEMDIWLSEFLGGQSAQFFGRLTTKVFNRQYAGLTVAKLKAEAKELSG